MSGNFNALANEFRSALQGLADVWRAESAVWNDAKSGEIARGVMTPVSGSCKKVILQFEDVNRELIKLAQRGLIKNR
jgi:hypothetical protein